jgi:hypothetical protein
MILNLKGFGNFVLPVEFCSNSNLNLIANPNREKVNIALT